MKVVLLSAASSVHTIRWANGLSHEGLDVHVISQHPQIEPMDHKVTLHLLPYRGTLGYFTIVPEVKKLLNRINPDIVNAHYASGYATTASLVGYHPWILSVWGSDIYDFPHTSLLHKFLVCRNLLSADKVASTSICMAKETQLLEPKLKNIAITPFGVDTHYYNSLTTSLAERNKSKEIIIGTVKTLDEKYGIDTLIKAFAIIIDDLLLYYPDVVSKIILRIVGDGPQYNALKALTTHLGISEKVKFVGRVNSTDVPLELNKLDIYVALSRSESFGVAIIEAGAAGRPVVVSDAGGLPEVVKNGQTGIVVPKENPQAAADAIKKLILDKNLRIQMGSAGKQHVANNYDWKVCVNKMISLYKDVITNN